MKSDLQLLAAELGHGRSSSAIIADALRRLIASNGLQVGDRLPSERELATSLGTSRSTVRGALHALVREGLISTQRGRSGGSVVKGRPRLERVTHTADTDVLADSREFRLAVEPVAAKLAAERASADERAALLTVATQPAPTLAVYQAHDSTFHLLVASASRNRVLRDALEHHLAAFFTWANSAWLGAHTFQTLHPSGAEFRATHEPVAEAIANRDGDEASRLMSEHLAWAYESWAKAFAMAYGAAADGGERPPQGS